MNPPSHRGKRVIKINAISFAKMCSYLMMGRHDLDKLAELTGLHKVTVMHYCRELHREGVCHIAKYAPDTKGRPSKIIYCLGEGIDAKRLNLSRAEISRRYRERKAKRKNQNDHHQ